MIPVSVIIPTYNRLAFLRQAVGSVLNQLDADFELIVVDDGSTDGTDEYLALLRKHSTGRGRPVTALTIDHTGMPGLARNAGARAAHGRLLAFLDSDDLWAPTKLSLQLAHHDRHPDSPVSHTRELWLRNGTVVSQKSQKHRREGAVFEDAVVKCIIGPSTAMVDRERFLALGGFREDLNFAEDYELWLRLVWDRPVSYLDEPLTIKRAGHDDQLSARFGEMERIRLEALRDLVDAGVFRGDPAGGAKGAAKGGGDGGDGADAEAIARRELVRKCRIYAAGARKRGRAEDAAAFESMGDRYELGSEPRE